MVTEVGVSPNGASKLTSNVRLSVPAVQVRSSQSSGHVSQLSPGSMMPLPQSAADIVGVEVGVGVTVGVLVAATVSVAVGVGVEVGVLAAVLVGVAVGGVPVRVAVGVVVGV